MQFECTKNKLQIYKPKLLTHYCGDNEMASLKARFIEFLRDEEGASAIEYALIAAMVAIALVAFVTPVRDAVTDIFTAIRTALEGAAATTP